METGRSTPATARHYGWMLGMPAIVAAAQIMGSFGASQGQPERRDLDWLAMVLLLAGPVALTMIRRFPVPVFGWTVAVTLTYLLLEYPYGPVILSVVVGVFGVVLAGHRLAALAGTAILYVGHFGGRFLLPGLDQPSPAGLLGVAAWLLVPLAVAELTRIRRERLAESRRARREQELRQAGEERLRIAQELHDVVAHHISLINVQAGVALHLMDQRPEQTRTALAAIKDASREALVELRSIVGILRQQDESAPRQPIPGLDRLDELVARTSQTGLDVHAVVHGERRPLPTGVDRAAYRIVQESLTNVVRHARASRATVRLRYDEDAVTLQVDDDGPATGPGGGLVVAEGNGITGMRERAAALGGTLTAGPRSGGGFRVAARLPVR
jgi:signal transduction histidine kinase